MLLMRTVLLLLCSSSVVRADGLNDENSVAGMVNAMAKQNEAIATLTAVLHEAKQMDRKHIQLTTGGEVVEMVRAADIKVLEKQIQACARRIDAQDAEIGTAVSTMREELNNGQLARELDATKSKLATQEARVSELSATVAQLLGTSRARPTPVDAAETTAARRLQESSPPSQPPPSPRSPPLSPPPAWPPLPAKANELRISGRHTAIAFNTNVDGVEPFRCVGVSDGKLTCSGELRAADFRTADGISLAELARFTGMVPPSVPPPPMPPTPPPAVYVSPGISTIQDAHDLASPGSELILADGIYLSSTSGTEVLRISKSIKVRALNPGQAVLHAQASAGNPACRRGSTCRRVIHILGGVVSLEGLNITGGMRDGYPYGGAGLAIVGGATVTVNKCNIYDNHVHNSGGLEINDRGGGVLITGRSTVSIVHSHIFGNTAENHGGVYVISGNAVLDSCLVYDSNVHAGCAYWNKRNLCTGREDGDEASVCYKSLALTNVQECA